MQVLADLSSHPQLDFWTEIGPNRPVYIMLTPKALKEDFLKQFNSVETVIENVQDLINKEKWAEPTQLKDNLMTWDEYYTFDQVIFKNEQNLHKNIQGKCVSNGPNSSKMWL